MTHAQPGTVVLCGAGVSVAAPSSVPSWWGFNQLVLDELRSRFVTAHRVPVRAAGALTSLSLDSLDVTEFSQIVSDAFAGDTWFDVLGVLDGVAPNINHHTLAAWAKAGPLRVVVTTNFDTLIERAMHEDGVEHRVFDCLLDEPPKLSGIGSPVAVVKLHGSASRRASLVDLAAQKRRGLPGDWLDWLEDVFGGLHVVVAGFSGADLALGEDYLRLRAASPRTPELTWLVRPGQRPLEGALEVVKLVGRRARFLEADLPGAWAALGAPSTDFLRVNRASHFPPQDCLPDDAAPDVSAAVGTWLEHPMVDADTCGMALTRLLDSEGKHSAATALRTSIRTRVRRRLREGLDITGATRAALQIGQLAIDEPPSRAAQAINGLDLASRALEAVLELLPPGSREQEAVRAEVAHNRATIMSNIAYFHVLSGRISEAVAAVEQAADYSSVLAGPRRLNQDAAQLEVLGAVAYLRGDAEQARSLWQEAHELAKRAGHRVRVKTTAENLRRLDGTPDLD